MERKIFLNRTTRSDRHYPTFQAQKGRELKEANRMRKERQKCRANKRDLEICKGCSQTELCGIDSAQDYFNYE